MYHPAEPHRYNFNPRPSARGDEELPQIQNRHRDFNPRPSARGDPLAGGSRARREISIHAPLRGATDTWPFDMVVLDISIHAPLRGATFRAHILFCGQCNFNPRPSARGD